MMQSEDQKALLLQIGRNCRAERARAGLLQDEVAHRASLGVAHYARIERGEVNSGLVVYVRIARALDVPIAELLRGIS